MTSAKRPTLGGLIPIVTGLVAVVGAVAYAIMRYSYQQFYDRFGLTPDDVGPSSAAALAQSGIRVAVFVAVFALLPLALALTVSQLVATALRSDFSRHSFAARHAMNWLHVLADLALPLVAALAVYRLFTAATSGSRELKEQIVLGIAVFLLASKRYADDPRRQDSQPREQRQRNGLARRFLAATSDSPSTAWIVAAVLTVGGALVLGGSLPRDARKTADCVIDRRQPVRWGPYAPDVPLDRQSESHGRAPSASRSGADVLGAQAVGESLPRRTSNAGSLVYLGNAGGRDFLYDTKQGRTLQVPDSSVVIATEPGPHCHWWKYRKRKALQRPVTNEDPLVFSTAGGV